MGSVNHERLEPLWIESARSYQTDRLGRKIPGSEKGGEKIAQTPEQVWDRIRDEEGYESGHSYSGNFAVKPGFIVCGKADVERDVLEAAAETVGAIGMREWDHEKNEVKPIGSVFEIPASTYCGWREGGWGPYCSQGKVTRTVKAKLPDGSEVDAQVKEDCPQCHGTGKRPLTAEEKAEAEKQIAQRKRAVAAFGMAALERAAVVYDDKWEEAAALVGKDHVWFGGYCSS